MAATEAELESYIQVLLMDRAEAMRQDEEEEEEAERRRRGPGSRIKKMKTATRKSSERADAPTEESDSDLASGSPARSDLARARKILKAAAANMWRKSRDCCSNVKTTAMTEEDVAAAAVYRAKAEEAHAKNQRTEEADAMAKWLATGDPEAIKRRDEWIEENMKAMDLADIDPTEDLSDDWETVQAKRFRKFWEFSWADCFGSFEDTTPIQPMLYTDVKPPPGTAYPIRTLQVFSVRITAIKDELEWPLDVFGIVAARDSVDHNRNIIFNRTRDNCQTIRRESPCLTLTGPTRAIVVEDLMHFEVTLQVKGTTESEDRYLSYLSLCCRDSGSSKSYVFKRVGTSKLSTVELVLGDMAKSVEATISVRVAGAGWPEGFQGVIFANTTSIGARKIELLTFTDDKLPVAADGTIQLSRRVVSVEADGELRVSVMATCLEGQNVARDSKTFKAKKASRSTIELEFLSCKLEVTVAWSLVPNLPHFH
uniref:Uncharacterized protein n=3 Tax=Avena sativa TaxID=4498 RepID=A0ACD5TYL6_AVESA